MAKAINTLQLCGIAHRNIRTENVIFDKDINIKIVANPNTKGNVRRIPQYALLLKSSYFHSSKLCLKPSIRPKRLGSRTIDRTPEDRQPKDRKAKRSKSQKIERQKIECQKIECQKIECRKIERRKVERQKINI